MSGVTDFALRTHAELSEAERDVLIGIIGGATTAEIAASRGTTVKTVETQRYHIQRKLGARNTAEMVRIALLGY